MITKDISEKKYWMEIKAAFTLSRLPDNQGSIHTVEVPCPRLPYEGSI